MANFGPFVRVRDPVLEVAAGDRVRRPLDVAKRPQPDSDEHEPKDDRSKNRRHGDEHLNEDEAAERARHVGDGVGDDEDVAVREFRRPHPKRWTVLLNRRHREVGDELGGVLGARAKAGDRRRQGRLGRLLAGLERRAVFLAVLAGDDAAVGRPHLNEHPRGGLEPDPTERRLLGGPGTLVALRLWRAVRRVGRFLDGGVRRLQRRVDLAVEVGAEFGGNREVGRDQRNDGDGGRRGKRRAAATVGPSFALAKHVPDEANGVDERRTERVELLAKVAHIGLDDVLVAAEVVVPDVVDDLVLRKDRGAG